VASLRCGGCSLILPAPTSLRSDSLIGIAKLVIAFKKTSDRFCKNPQAHVYGTSQPSSALIAVCYDDLKYKMAPKLYGSQ
jgi:hypothetical protein